MIKYDCDYFFNLLRIQSATAKIIADIRWSFVVEINPLSVLDYGCGCGFFKAFAPPQVVVNTFDIMPVPQSGIMRQGYSLVTFWDVLEHIDWEHAPDKGIEEAIQMGNYVAITVPILPLGKDFKKWKHNKKGEHLHRFKTMDAVEHFFKQRGFELVKISKAECILRQDIVSFLFKKCKS